MSIMAKHNNRIQTIENNREINHENGVHLPLKCAILELELEIEKRFCKACRQRPSQKLGFRVSGRNFLLQANDLRSYPSFGWAFVFLGQCWVERACAPPLSCQCQRLQLARYFIPGTKLHMIRPAASMYHPAA